MVWDRFITKQEWGMDGELKTNFLMSLYHEDLQLGFDLINQAIEGTEYSYEVGKKALQSLRQDGSVHVVKKGQGKRANWVAYQTFTLTMESLAWANEQEQKSSEHFKHKIMTWMKLLGVAIDRPSVRVGAKFEQWDVLQVLVKSGWVKLKMIPTDEGKEWLTERQGDVQ